ncbi:MAG: hypothetical protein KC476_02015 [Cyanobacteria bacterium HKST-UBA06]|nr:hypothetical protein [Cyanobacteria bacterium HKST-UBA05]MCA9799752.1 hypothetical protein [Cyanobacteria bacterium HKST-UBA04]MCA9806705.1 hypothetical protein [Cyanobacteria bacterium HKST-UBA06]MCA9840780.1 hypothetical protein [Cyanobacteria bacterium HKST-UBA03]
MLPVVTADIRESVEQAIEANPDEWKREMIHHIKEENPELNSLLLTMAQNAQDPKHVIMAGYMVYKALEIAEASELD